MKNEVFVEIPKKPQRGEMIIEINV